MARRCKLTDKDVANLKPRAKRYAVSDPDVPGHWIRVQPSGAKSYVAIAADPRGRQVWHTVGLVGLLSLDEAREQARNIIKSIKAGADRAGPQSFASVAEQWLERHVDAKGLRTAALIRRALNVHVLPQWGSREFTSIHRGDVARLLDDVEDQAGAQTADAVLAHISRICNWYATRHDNYVSPIVCGMRRSNPKETARARILDDDEIRSVWRQAEANGTFGAIVRVLLLTAQRRDKVATMRWQDISLDGTWHIPSEPREKSNAGALVLPEQALAIIQAQPRFADNPYVFAKRAGYLTGFSKAKAAFDAKLPDMPQWQLHDLRRTARSLMSRAGIRPDLAERVLGHAIRGVEGVYDRHSYRDEMADALRRLAALINNIVTPPVGNVVSMMAAQ
jgi:integrase